LFFFSSSSYHRDLHSFPTRRSSDLSDQVFVIEAQITIINVQSYPVVGGTWQVRFNTTGTANLTITTVNGTTWSDSNENNDLKFLDRKSTRLNSSHVAISYAVFCLKK